MNSKYEDNCSLLDILKCVLSPYTKYPANISHTIFLALAGSNVLKSEVRNIYAELGYCSPDVGEAPTLDPPLPRRSEEYITLLNEEKQIMLLDLVDSRS